MSRRSSALGIAIGAIACLSIGASALAAEESIPSPPPSSAREGSTPLVQLIAVVAKKTGRKFIVDPRVRGDALIIGQEPSTVGYDELLSILQIHGFTAIAAGNYVKVVPDASARQMATPMLTGKETHAEAEYVSRIIPVKSLPSAQLVPILRPLLPQQAHMVAIQCSNVLIMVDSFANVKRIESLVQQLDTGKPFDPEPCGAPKKE